MMNLFKLGGFFQSVENLPGSHSKKAVLPKVNETLIRNIQKDPNLAVFEKEYQIDRHEIELLEKQGEPLRNRVFSIWNEVLQGKGMDSENDIETYDLHAARHKVLKKKLQNEEKRFSFKRDPKKSAWFPNHEKILLMGFNPDCPLSVQLAHEFQSKVVPIKEKIKQLKRDRRDWLRKTETETTIGETLVRLDQQTAVSAIRKELGEFRLRLFQSYLLRILDVLGEPNLPEDVKIKMEKLFEKYLRFYQWKLYGKKWVEARCRFLSLSRYAQSRTLSPNEFRLRFDLVKEFGYSIFRFDPSDLKSRIDRFFIWSEEHPNKAGLIADEVGILIASLNDKELIDRFNKSFNVVVREKDSRHPLSKSEFATFVSAFNPGMDPVSEEDTEFLELADMARVFSMLNEAGEMEAISDESLIKQIRMSTFAYESNSGVYPSKKTPEGKMARNLSAIRSDQAEKQMLQVLGAIVKSHKYLLNAYHLIQISLYTKVEKWKNSQLYGLKEIANIVKYFSFMFRSQESWKARLGRFFVTGVATFGTIGATSLAITSVVLSGTTIPAIIIGIGSVLGFVATGYAFWKFGNRIIDSLIDKHYLIDLHEKEILNKKIATHFLEEVRKIGALPVALGHPVLSVEEVNQKNTIVEKWKKEIAHYVESRMTGKFTALGPMGVVMLFNQFIQEKGRTEDIDQKILKAATRSLIEGWLQEEIETYQILPPHLPREKPLTIEGYIDREMEKLGFKEELMDYEVKDLFYRLSEAGLM